MFAIWLALFKADQAGIQFLQFLLGFLDLLSEDWIAAGE
jgi:hypothetical protein